jgi:16S rRNA (guanine527-N7)-methyltransferase
MLKENESALKTIAANFDLSPRQIEQLSLYVDLLESWSLRTNLISKNDRVKIVSRHILESLEIARHDYIQNSFSVVDLGTGSGLPGIPLAIFYPQVQFTLLDSKRKKILFLQEVVDRLELENVKAVCVRAEDFSLENPCDVLTARAVARLKELWSLGRSFLKLRGVLVALKGGDMENEIAELEYAFDVRVKVVPFQKLPHQDSPDKKIVVVSPH